MTSVLPRNPSSLPRLHLAAARGEDGKIQQYLAAGDDVNARDVEGVTALLWAVYGGHSNACSVLLAAGADPSTSDNDQFFPLYMAAQNGNLPIAEALLRGNADMNAVADRPDGGTALCVAAFKGNQVQLLLHAGCDTSKAALGGGQYPLTTASRGGHTDVVTMLLDAGADVSPVGSDGRTALTAGTEKGSCDVIRKLLERGADVNQPTPEGTALHMAAHYGFDDATRVLVAAGANVDQVDSRKGMPLHVAAIRGHPACVYALLRAGANVSARTDHGASPLHNAAYKGHTDVIEVLLSAGAQRDVNHEDNVHCTALTSASEYADVKAVILLIDAGADINRPNGLSRTALFYAADVKIVKALLDRGGNVKGLDKIGATVLHSAGGRGTCAGVICALYRAGVDPTAKTKAGYTAADIARREGHEDAAKLLDLLAAKWRSMNST